MHVNANQNKHKISDLFANYAKKIKTNLQSSIIVTVVAKYLNSALNEKVSQDLLHDLFDSGSEGSFINIKWTTFGNTTKIASPTS